MFRGGASDPNMRPMATDDIFKSRLNLLIIMAKAYLKGYPLGKFRKSAALQNSRIIFCEVLCRSDRSGPLFSSRNESYSCANVNQKQILLQRIQLLAVMVTASIEKTDFGAYRKKAMAENVAYICEHLVDPLNIAEVQFLNVA